MPDELLLQCIDVAEQAPCGAAQPSRRWLVVKHPALKAELAGWYREIGYPALRAEFGWPVPGDADYEAGEPRGNSQAERVFRSALHLAANLERVPALVLCTIYGEHDRIGSPGLFDSVIQAAWSFCLAARARGLGTTWTTAHLFGRAADTAALLGIPPGVTQITLLPVAYTTGGDFHPAERPSATDITFFDYWGVTGPGSDHPPTVTLDVDIEAPVEIVWGLLVKAAADAGPVEEEEPGTTCSWAGDGVRGRFTVRPKIYGGTRVGCSVQMLQDAGTGSLLEVRSELSNLLTTIKDDAEDCRGGNRTDA